MNFVRYPGSVALRLSAALLMIWACAMNTGALAAATETANKGQTVTAAVAKPLQDAQSAIGKKNWTAALADIERAESVADRTPRDNYTIDTLLAYVLYKQGKFAEAAPVYERLIDSQLMPASEKPARMKAIAEMYARSGDPRKTIHWSKQYLESPGAADNADVLALAGNAYYRLKEYRNAAETMRKAVAAAERAKRKPEESWLRVVSNACFESNDTDCLIESLKKLVVNYAKQDDWAALLSRLVANVDDPHVLFGYRSLMIDLGVLKNPEDYEAAVFAALNADLPNEARQMLASGKEILNGPDALPGHYERLLKSVEEKAAVGRADAKRLAQSAAATANGRDDVLLGRKLLGAGDYAGAIAALRRGMKSGGLDDVGAAKISLGTAYYKAGQRDLAAKTFKSVGVKSKWRDLAELWTLRSGVQFYAG